MGAGASSQKAQQDAEEKQRREAEKLAAAAAAEEIRRRNEEEAENFSHQLTPEQQEMFEIAMEVNDAAFIAAEDSKENPTMEFEFQYSKSSDYVYDSFVSSTGKTFTCFQDASNKWFYIDWAKQNQLPMPLPESWIRDGGYFLRTKNRGIDNRFSSCDDGLIVDLPCFDDAFFKHSSQIYDVVTGQMIFYHTFPSIRPVRYFYDRKSGCWSQISIQTELIIPEVKQTVDLIEKMCNNFGHFGETTLPTSRETILQTLRDNGYDLNQTLKSYQLPFPPHESKSEGITSDFGYWEPDKMIEKDDSAISLFMNSKAKQICIDQHHQNLTRVQEKCDNYKQDNANLIQDNKNLEIMLGNLREELALQRCESGNRDQALVDLQSQILEKDKTILNLQQEISSLRMTRLDMLSELPSKIIEQKDLKLACLVSTVANLQRRIHELQEWRRKFGISAIKAWTQLKCQRKEFQHLKREFRNQLNEMHLETLNIVRILSERISTIEKDKETLQASLLIEQQSYRLFKNFVNNAQGGMTLVCKISGNSEKQANDSTGVRLFGERGVIVKTRTNVCEANFHYVFPFSASQTEFYAKCLEKHVLGCLVGINFCVVSLGNAKASLLQETPQSREGIISMAVNAILNQINSGYKSAKMQLTFSCLMTCREKVYDMLSNRETSLSAKFDTDSSGTASLKLAPEPAFMPIQSSDTFSQLQQSIKRKLGRLKSHYGFAASKICLTYVFTVKTTSVAQVNPVEARLVFVDFPATFTPTSTAKDVDEGMTLSMLQEHLSVEQLKAAFCDAIRARRCSIAADSSRSTLASNTRCSMTIGILADHKYGRMCLERSSMEDNQIGRTLIVANLGMEVGDEEESLETLIFVNKLCNRE